MLSPLSFVGLGLAWYSMDGSLIELRQMAQCSAQESQLHMATAFHFLISNRGAGMLPGLPPLPEVAAVADSSAAGLFVSLAESSITMSSTMVASSVCCLCCWFFLSNKNSTFGASYVRFCLSFDRLPYVWPQLRAIESVFYSILGYLCRQFSTLFFGLFVCPVFVSPSIVSAGRLKRSRKIRFEVVESIVVVPPGRPPPIS